MGCSSNVLKPLTVYRYIDIFHRAVFNALAARLEKNTHGGDMEFKVELAQNIFC
jgi:hypothetical protein